MGEDDNFWPAGAPTHGPNGVCGPCSEIFYHGAGSKEVEIWNLVFTQFNRVGPGQLEPLPKKNIDTGMGLERSAACLQGVSSVFETDVFKPIVAAVAGALGVEYKSDHPDGVRIRRMSDHVRALTFCIHENVRPGPEKQGYVIRRLLRRAVLDAYQMGRREPFLHQIVPVVAEVMSRPYPELRESARRVATTIKQEEEQFLRNLENGLRILNDTFQKTRAAGSETISGKDAFTLHATYGIPVEVVESLAADHNLRIDRLGFEAEQKEHSAVSRGTTEAAAVFSDRPARCSQARIPPRQRVSGLRRHRRRCPGDRDHRAESPGRIGPRGRRVGAGPDPRSHAVLRRGGRSSRRRRHDQRRAVFLRGARHQERERVHPARRPVDERCVDARAAGSRLGRCRPQAGNPTRPHRDAFAAPCASRHPGQARAASWQQGRARPAAVRFRQSGSRRPRALRAIEEAVNLKVLEAAPVTWATMPIAQAKGLGAMALFGEKYPDIVRVVQMGEYSRELCGGTHLDNVGQVGPFKIIGEESVAAGTRRITALVGKAALDYVRDEEEILANVASQLRIPASQIG